MAYLGDNAVEVPASLMPCANCHGLDARGKPEAGVKPSNITWQALTKPYGGTGQRKHPPYTERAFEIAITRGLDPGGNKLHPAMPRYDISKEDLSDLIAYLKQIGGQLDPGLSDDKVIIGTVIPRTEIGLVMRSLLAAYFEEINAQGGLYNRKIELRAVESNDPKAGLEALIERESVFAILGTFTAGADEQIAQLAERKRIPLIGPITPFPQEGLPPNRYVFYIFSGIKQQARTLIKFAAEKLHPRDVAILHAQARAMEDAARAAAEEWERNGQTVRLAKLDRDLAQIAASLKGAEAVLFFGSAAELKTLAQEAEKIGWNPTLLCPGSLIGREVFDLPSSFNGKILASFPLLPSDQSSTGAAKLSALVDKYKLPKGNLAAQISAYCAADLFLEALKLAGRDLSREKLMSALESFYEFDTGLAPPITYTPNRHIGALGAHVVAVEIEKKRFIPLGKWISLSDP
jgi:ABC-type branched-subunit amino acid transport system substrate-binding protein